jgi:hypothetical protein
MVKYIVFSLVVALSGTTLRALEPSLDDMGHPYYGKDVEIIWEAPTNQLPTSLKVFEVLPASFSETTVSNLIVAAGFEEQAKARARLRPASRGKTAFFEELETGKYLRFSPELGHISYVNHRVIALPSQPVERVPTKEKTLELALALLPALEITESELARKPDGNQLQLAHILQEHGSFDKQERKVVKRAIAQGVIISRAVDGVAFNGRGDCGNVRVLFGNHEEIAELQVVWRKLRPKREVKVAAKEQIMQWIRNGHAVIEGDGSVHPSQIKQLTITQISACYLGKDVSEKQKTVYPYAMLTATAKTDFTNTVVRLNCPIFK